LILWKMFEFEGSMGLALAPVGCFIMHIRQTTMIDAIQMIDAMNLVIYC
jgi:hypothetical protein